MSSITHLHDIYTPQVLGSSAFDTDQLIHDDFERSYVTRWLIKVISMSNSYPSLPHVEALDDVFKSASNMLALISGATAAPAFARHFSYTLRSALEQCSIHALIRDDRFLTSDFSSVGVQTWGSACILTEMITQHPERFGIERSRQQLRIAELGAGTGLLSIVVAKMLQHWGKRDTCVFATDFHPAVLTNLEANIDANFDSVARQELIHSKRLDWSDFMHPEHQHSLGQFDVIFGADILYEKQHAVWIQHVLQSLLPNHSSVGAPGTSQTPAFFHLVFPLRSTHSAESQTLEHVFPSLSSAQAISMLAIHKAETICHQNTTDDNVSSEMRYRYYQIGWSRH